MMYQSITKLTDKTDSRYSLAIAVAKRARQIYKDETKEVSKPIVEAINEIYNDKVEIISSEKEKDIQENEE